MTGASSGKEVEVLTAVIMAAAVGEAAVEAPIHPHLWISALTLLIRSVELRRMTRLWRL